jgi:hypothetical protein
MPMMPFHHDSGECGFGQNWVVASVCDPGIGGREMGWGYPTNMHAPGVPACLARGPRELVRCTS